MHFIIAQFYIAQLRLQGRHFIIFKLGACHAPGFLKLILCGLSVCMYMCVCVSMPEAINN